MKRNVKTSCSNSTALFENLEDRRLMSAASLDPGFGTGGVKMVDFLAQDNVHGMCTQTDGKTLVVEDTSDNGWLVSRFNVDGTLDTGFGQNGARRVSFGDDPTAAGIAVQSNGNIVIVGSARTILNNSYLVAARLTSKGNIDNSFGYFMGGGGAKSNNGISYFELDVPTFYGTAKAYATSCGVVVSGDGSFYIGATADVHISTASYDDNFMAVMHVNADGKLDTNYGAKGIASQDVDHNTINAGGDQAKGIARQVDGKILLTGVSDGKVCVERFTTAGEYDSSFGYSGAIRWDFPNKQFNEAGAIDVGPDGKIVVAGNTFIKNTGWVWAISRLTSNGQLDNSFDYDGMKTMDVTNGADIIHAVKVMPDGKILAAGVGSINGGDDFTLARFNTSGKLDSTFGGFGGITAIDIKNNSYDEVKAMSITPTGRVTLAGTAITNNGDKLVLARFVGHAPTFKIFAVGTGKEGTGKNAQFKITRDGDPYDGSYDLGLIFSGTAIQGQDYTVPFNGKLHWMAGQSTMIVDLPVVNDNQKEAYESIRVDLQSSPFYDIDGSFSWTQIGIYDND